MLSLALILCGAVAVAAGGVVASRWEAANEEEEEELERLRAKNKRIKRMCRARHEKNKRKKEIEIELLARSKELKLVRRAEMLARRNMEVGRLEVDQFNKDLATANASSVRLPEKWVVELSKELTSRTKDLSAVHRRCARHKRDVERRIVELKGKRFFYKCSRCHRKFAVTYGDLNKFARSRKGLRKCCDECLPEVKARAAKRMSAKKFSCVSKKLALAYLR